MNSTLVLSLSVDERWLITCILVLYIHWSWILPTHAGRLTLHHKSYIKSNPIKQYLYQAFPRIFRLTLVPFQRWYVHHITCFFGWWDLFYSSAQLKKSMSSYVLVQYSAWRRVICDGFKRQSWMLSACMHMASFLRLERVRPTTSTMSGGWYDHAYHQLG